MAEEWIEVKGARTHNLRNIDVSLPRESSSSFQECPDPASRASLSIHSMRRGKGDTLRA